MFRFASSTQPSISKGERSKDWLACDTVALAWMISIPRTVFRFAASC